MNQAIQPESSNALQILPMKRRRGRPRKDQSLNRLGFPHDPPGFGAMKENKSQKADKVDVVDGMVGQAVTGVVEASFDAGYLLTVRIGNSHTIFRGVVFRPGHYVPVTSENDVASHVQMIRRSEVSLPLYNQTQSSNTSIERNNLQGSSPQVANMTVSKEKSASPTTGPLVPPLGARGTVVPVVLQPFSPANGPPPAGQVILDASPSKGGSVVTQEPLAMLPFDKPASSGQFQVLLSQVQTSNQLPAGSIGTEIEIGSCNEIAPVVAQKEAQEVKPTEVLTAGDPLTGSQGSSQSSETHVSNDKSSSGTSHMDSDQEIGSTQLPSNSIPMNIHATGRMTELLQALQQNFVSQIPPYRPSVGSGVESQEKENPETNGEDKRRCK